MKITKDLNCFTLPKNYFPIIRKESLPISGMFISHTRLKDKILLTREKIHPLFHFCVILFIGRVILLRNYHICSNALYEEIKRRNILLNQTLLMILCVYILNTHWDR